MNTTKLAMVVTFIEGTGQHKVSGLLFTELSVTTSDHEEEGNKPGMSATIS